PSLPSYNLSSTITLMLKVPTNTHRYLTNRPCPLPNTPLPCLPRPPASPSKRPPCRRRKVAALSLVVVDGQRSAAFGHNSIPPHEIWGFRGHRGLGRAERGLPATHQQPDLIVNLQFGYWSQQAIREGAQRRPCTCPAMASLVQRPHWRPERPGRLPGAR